MLVFWTALSYPLKWALFITINLPPIKKSKTMLSTPLKWVLFWKSFSGVFKRGLVLFFQIIFQDFLFFIYLYRIVLFLADIFLIHQFSYNCVCVSGRGELPDWKAVLSTASHSQQLNLFSVNVFSNCNCLISSLSSFLNVAVLNFSFSR